MAEYQLSLDGASIDEILSSLNGLGIHTSTYPNQRVIRDLGIIDVSELDNYYFSTYDEIDVCGIYTFRSTGNGNTSYLIVGMCHLSATYQVLISGIVAEDGALTSGSTLYNKGFHIYYRVRYNSGWEAWSSIRTSDDHDADVAADAAAKQTIIDNADTVNKAMLDLGLTYGDLTATAAIPRRAYTTSSDLNKAIVEIYLTGVADAVQQPLIIKFLFRKYLNGGYYKCQLGIYSAGGTMVAQYYDSLATSDTTYEPNSYVKIKALNGSGITGYAIINWHEVTCVSSTPYVNGVSVPLTSAAYNLYMSPALLTLRLNGIEPVR